MGLSKVGLYVYTAMEAVGGGEQFTHLCQTHKSADEHTSTHIHSFQQDSARDHGHVFVTTTTIRQLKQQKEKRTPFPTT